MTASKSPGMQVLVTGGTGFIGDPLVSTLSDLGHRVLVLTRQENLLANNSATVRYINSVDAIDADEHIDTVINLAGESLAAKRWTDRQKQKLVSSRLEATRQLLNLAQALRHKPAVLLNASAIGYYGPQGDRVLDEAGATVDCFSHRLCQQWEDTALEFERFGSRVCLLRFGVVLGRNGGPFSELRKSFDFGVATQFGSGEQWLSWVHRDDVVGAIIFALKNDAIDGPINTTAPEPVTNKQFCIAMQEFKRTFIKVQIPSFALRLLVGEMAEELLLTGQRVYPQKLVDNGYTFKYPDLQKALRDLLAK